MVIKRHVLVSIIGFLSGLILNLAMDFPMEFALYGGLAGYFIGLFLDHADTTQQIQAYHFRTLNSTHQEFTLDAHPHTTVLYSARENVAAVVLHYRVNEKPEDFRLSVVKNLRDFEFEISERETHSLICIEITYAEFNYPHHALLHTPEYTEFLFDIEEKGRDFQAAIQKVVPGLTLIPDPQKPSSSLGQANNEHRTHTPTPSTPPPPVFPPPPLPPTFPEQGAPTAPHFPQEVTGSPSHSSINDSSPLTRKNQEIPVSQNNRPFPPATASPPSPLTEQSILNDLRREGSEVETTLPTLSPGEADQLLASNDAAFESFLEEGAPSKTPQPDESDPPISTPTREASPGETSTEETSAPEDIPIDFSAVGAPIPLEEDTHSRSRDRFNEDISVKFADFNQKKTN